GNSTSVGCQCTLSSPPHSALWHGLVSVAAPSGGVFASCSMSRTLHRASRKMNGRRSVWLSMAPTSTYGDRIRELAHRSADGIDVTLVWNTCRDAVSVLVFERDADYLFELPVAREQAMDAFYHPYAYAA